MRAELGKDPTRAPQSQLDLPPGFRFYPTDEELVEHYLCKKAACEPFAVPIIAEVELYKFDPWDLPAKALFGEREWYFFSPRDRKYPNGSRPNRAAGGGYWKATGTDKPISSLGGKKKVGVKKALVFYKGKAPKGVKTNWIMHEYRLADVGLSASRPSAKRKGNLRLDDWVLCRIYKKSSSAANQEKEVSEGLDDMEAEQSESSGLDDVLVALSELDDPLDAACTAEAEGAGAHAETQFSLLKRKHSSLESSLEQIYYDPLSYSSQDDEWKDGMEELHGRAGLDILSADNGRSTKECRSEYAPGARSIAAVIDNAATPESNLCSRQSSPLEQAQSTCVQQAGEEMAMESTVNALGRLPLTQLLSSQSLAMANSSLFGLDLGLPSPCTMFAQGASFGTGMDPDNYFFQSPRLSIGDPCKINF